MSVRVQLPPMLRHAMGGERWLEAEGISVAAVLRDLGQKHPRLKLHFFDEQGAIRHNIVCVHGGSVVRAREMAAHHLHASDEIVLTNALAGG
ncbi:MAG: MoaD/ThiS family protein [Alphaproteobacteria bacterium]|nr:MoaD/ThiS family protein [Alphaproteobacteria bacterium]